MTIPIGTRVIVDRHWLVQGFHGEIVGHRAEHGHRNDNDVLLDHAWVSHAPNPNPHFCRRIYLADEDLIVEPQAKEA